MSEVGFSYGSWIHCVFTDFWKYFYRSYLCYILCRALLSEQLGSEGGRELFTSGCCRKLLPKLTIPIGSEKGCSTVTLMLWENNRKSIITLWAAWENWWTRSHLVWIFIDEQELSKQRSWATLTLTSGPLHMLFSSAWKAISFHSILLLLYLIRCDSFFMYQYYHYFLRDVSLSLKIDFVFHLNKKKIWRYTPFLCTLFWDCG